MGARAESPSLCFVVGPLRTGSSLMSRCLDDHPVALCLCESEVNRALFRDYFLKLHANRMTEHGVSPAETIELLNRKKQDDPESLTRWYSEAARLLSRRYQKPAVSVVGDKSPDLFRSPQLVEWLAGRYPLVYTVRDPRAIFRSIDVQDDATAEDKEERWESLAQNYEVWKPYLDRDNVLTVRYEDFVLSPQETMSAVYRHVGLPESTRFLEPFRRPFPGRFLWTTAIDRDTGVSKEFDPGRIAPWKAGLNRQQLDRIHSHPTVAEFMERFGYEREP